VVCGIHFDSLRRYRSYVHLSAEDHNLETQPLTS
jgi:hypothetical protein